jgi:hypothetical protein
VSNVERIIERLRTRAPTWVGDSAKVNCDLDHTAANFLEWTHRDSQFALGVLAELCGIVGGCVEDRLADQVRRIVALNASLSAAIEVPRVWSEAERDALCAAWNRAQERGRGHYETIFAIAAESLRLAQKRAENTNVNSPAHIPPAAGDTAGDARTSASPALSSFPRPQTAGGEPSLGEQPPAHLSRGGETT